MNRPYYVTWSETRNRVTTDYILCDVYGPSARAVKARIVEEEQNERRNRGLPFMFFLTVTAHRPADAARRKRGHLYY